MQHEDWKEVFNAVKKDGKIKLDTLLALENALEVSGFPYFVLVYVGTPEGGKLVASKKQAKETIVNLMSDLDNCPATSTDPDLKDIAREWD